MLNTGRTNSTLNILVLSIFIFIPGISISQPATDTTIIAGSQYKKGMIHQALWGKHYRKDWTIPVRVQIISLDTIDGGLKAYQAGGGRQSKTLRLTNPAGKEYVIRSIDKSFGKALPDLYRGTFIEKIIDDQVSIAEPYAALTIAPMAEAAGIYHTNPVIGFIPRQNALGDFNEEFGNSLYLLEQRPDENWEEAANFGNAKKLVGTDKMLENIWEDNDNRIDQYAFAKARIFDMLIGDWGRHEDQWRWGVRENDDEKTYFPVPRDRDQAYTKFDGLLLSIGISAAGAGHLEGFGPGIKHIDSYNYPARNLDRRATNELTREDWIRAAREIQKNVTDAVIEDAIRRLPAEVYSNYGPWLVETLKARREKLESFAGPYYDFLAKQVEIPGTHKAEYFQVTTEGSGTIVKIFDLDKKGEKKEKPFYSRTFSSGETREIRIYGLAGNDQYFIDGEKSNGTKIRLIAGPGQDSYSFNGSRKNILVYEDSLNEKPLIHYYDYAGFNYDDKGPGPVISYNSEDHIHAGLKYEIEKQGWRKYPFASRQEIAAKYSFSEYAWSFGYEGVFNQVIGKWNLLLNGSYDQVRWNNFFGIGNETEMIIEDRDYHRVRTREVEGSLGLQRTMAFYHDLRITGLVQSVRVLNDLGRFHTEQVPKLAHFNTEVFGGGLLQYSYNRLNDQVVPTRGIVFRSSVRYLDNLENDSSVLNYGGEFLVYVPLSKSFVFHMKTGAASLAGQPEFYQLNRIGGAKSLRGFRKYRFHGHTTFYNQAEIQFIRDIRTFIMNGKAGLIALFDAGRVWQPGENSNRWYNGYGAGIMLAPFNKISVAVFYALSRGERDISVRFTKGLN